MDVKEQPEGVSSLLSPHTQVVRPGHTQVVRPGHTQVVRPSHTQVVRPGHTQVVRPGHSALTDELASPRPVMTVILTGPTFT